MLLPQSTAFVTLRNRLNSVSSFGYLHTIPKTSAYVFLLLDLKSMRLTSQCDGYSAFTGTTGTSTGAAQARSVIRKQDDIKWADLLTSFRSLQFRHQRARRHALQAGSGMFHDLETSPTAAVTTLPSSSQNSTSLMNMGSIAKGGVRRPATGSAGGPRGSLIREGAASVGGRSAQQIGKHNARSSSSNLRPLSPPSVNGGRRLASNIQPLRKPA